MKAKIKTSDNYKEFNGHFVIVKRIYGNGVDCLVPEFGFDELGEPQGRLITSTFSLSEIEEFTYHEFLK